MKKVLSIIITVCVLLSAMTISIYAINLSLTTTRIMFAGDSVLVSDNALEEAIEITSEEARYIAELFITDMIESGTCCWDEDTEIVDIVTLYNENGTAANAHTVELTDGYVVISAFADSESLIPEWSDTAEPLYENLANIENDNIIYLGGYEYFVDSNTTSVTDLDGNTVNKVELVNYVEKSRDINNMPEALVESCVVTPDISLLSHKDDKDDDGYDDKDGSIIDPHIHAEKYYYGDFTTTNYCNQWEEDMFYYTTSQSVALGWPGSCGLVAITTIIESYKARYPYRSDIPSANTVCNFVGQYGSTHTKELNGVTKYYYLPYNLYNQDNLLIQGMGTDINRSPYFILDCLNYYDIPTNVVGNFGPNYDSIKTHLEEGCLLFLSMNGHELYNNHAVVCFAYTRMVSDKTGYYKTFLKIADGWHDTPRYIDLASIQYEYDVNGELEQGGWYTKVGLWG